MKNWIMSFILVPLVFVGCADDKNSNPGTTAGTIATVPPPTTSCVDGSAYCNSGLYNNNNGFYAYPNNPYYHNLNYAWNGYFGGSIGGYVGNFCNCPIGTRPVYNGQFGLGCVSTMSFQAYAGAAVYWGYGANNNQWVNIPQVSNSQGYPQSRCFQNVAQSCFVDQLNSCGPGRICQTTGGGSRLGICIAQGVTNTSAGSIGGYR